MTRSGDAEQERSPDTAPPSEPRLELVISVPRAIEERVIDWLLELRDVRSFTSAEIDLHGADATALRGGERVSGRQRRTEFRVHIPAARLDAMVRALDEEFAGTSSSWLAMPIAASGRLR